MSASAGGCEGAWSPILAAGPQSTLSGVLAGVVFAGTVVVLSTIPLSGRRHVPTLPQRSYALQLLSSTFIIFALDSYFASVTAGELSCNRANAESLLSGGVLGTGASLLLAALGWLVVTYFDHSHDVRVVLGYMIVGIWIVIISMLTISAVNVGDAILAGRHHEFVNIAPWPLAALMVVAVTAVALRSRGISDDRLRKPVKLAALTALAAAISSALFTGIASAFSASAWQHPDAAVVDILIIVSMMVPGAALVISVPAAIGAISRSRDAKMLIQTDPIKPVSGKPDPDPHTVELPTQ